MVCTNTPLPRLHSASAYIFNQLKLMQIIYCTHTQTHVNPTTIQWRQRQKCIEELGQGNLDGTVLGEESWRVR